MVVVDSEQPGVEEGIKPIVVCVDDDRLCEAHNDDTHKLARVLGVSARQVQRLRVAFGGVSASVRTPAVHAARRRV